MSDMVDICLIAEGSYPYAKGVEASCIHALVTELREYRFCVVSLVAPAQETRMLYAMPANVVMHTTHRLGDLPATHTVQTPSEPPHADMRASLMALVDGSVFDEHYFPALLRACATQPLWMREAALLNDKMAWEIVLDAYEAGHTHISFLDFFWTYRAMLTALVSVLTLPLPPARAYHAMSTGYAGILGARVKHETGKPLLVSECGLYTQERRMEILTAQWVQQQHAGLLSVDNIGTNPRDIWIGYFEHMGRAAYHAADHIMALSHNAQAMQHKDGALAHKTRVIAAGIDVERFAELPRTPHTDPTIASIGPVVPAMDLKTLMYAVAMVVQTMPSLQVLVFGAMDEDVEYTASCQQLMSVLGLDHVIKFMGLDTPELYFPTLDVVVSTALVQTYPLALLEAGAAGIPVIAPDVGACREIVCGMHGEAPAHGDGGIITTLANPQATADAIIALLSNLPRCLAAGQAMKARIAMQYRHTMHLQAYRTLYHACLEEAV